MMKGKIAMIFFAAIILTLAFSPLTNATPNLSIYGYADKAQYKLGDSGSIKFWVVNYAADAATLKNVTIQYPWYMRGLGGNKTIKITGVTLTENQNWSSTDAFTIPNDGRVPNAGSVQIVAYFEYTISNVVYSSSRSGSVSMNIAAVPFYMSTTELGMIQTLLILNIIITLVGAIIIAAAIFMTKRGPPAPPQ